MKRWASGVLAVLGLVLVFLVWRHFFPGDEARIRQVIARAAKAGSVAGNEGDLGRTIKAADLASLCTSDISVKVDALGMRGGLDGRDQVRMAAMQLGNTFGNYRIVPGEIVVREIGDGSARVTLTASFEGGTPADFNAQEFELGFRKVEGRWLIARVETVRALRR